MDKMVRSLRAEHSDLREDILASPLVAWSWNDVPRGTGDRRVLNSDEECGLKTGAEESICDVFDHEVTSGARRRSSLCRLPTRSGMESEFFTDLGHDQNYDQTPHRRHSWKGPRKCRPEDLRTAGT